MSCIKHIIFDFDGTLVDSAPSIIETFKYVLSAAKITATIPIDHNVIGPPLTATLKKISGLTDPSKIEHLCEQFKAIYDSSTLLETKPYQDVEAALNALRSHSFTLHIATNKRQSPTLKLLQHLNWQSIFACVYCIDTAPNEYTNKSGMIKTLMSSAHIQKEQAVYIGDTYGDHKAANDCEIQFFAANWGYGDWTSNKAPTSAGSYASIIDFSRALIASQ